MINDNFKKIIINNNESNNTNNNIVDFLFKSSLQS